MQKINCIKTALKNNLIKNLLQKKIDFKNDYVENIPQ